MQVTAFGLVYMPLLLAVVLFARGWLPGLVLGSAVFQAAAVVNVPVGSSYYGISPYLASAGAVGAVMLWRRLGAAKSPILPPSHLRTPAIWLLVYAVLAITGSFLLPRIFEGLPVQPPLDPNGYALKELPPLFWSISNLAQAANLFVHITVACFFWQSLNRRDWSMRYTIAAFGAASGIALIAGLHDGAALLLERPRMASFWMSNIGYALVDNVLYQMPYLTPAPDGSTYAILYRISSPFSEPSYGSAFMASAYAGLVAVFLLTSHKRVLVFVALFLFGLGLLNTTGSTGWVAGFVATLTLIAVFVWKQIRNTKQREKTHYLHWRLFVVAVLLVSSAIAALWQSPLWRAVPAIGNAFIFNKAATLGNDGRFLSDVRAITLTQQTVGLGVGMGSNRTSSFLTSLLSNTGIAGALAFLSMLATLMARFIRARQLSPSQHFTSVALGTCMFAVSLSIPDLNLPFLWAFIFLAFALCPAQSTRPTATGTA
ncbi:MAG: hypothetical protein Q8S02_07950 [Hydrogenophaga sp.]|nr:hypothetical protein [Hydrogenophaga sp.]